MRILLTVHHDLDPNSGAPGSTLSLVREYKKLGHDVEIYSYDDLPRWASGKVKLFCFPEFVAWHLTRRLKKQQLDVIDASTGDAWLWATVLRRHHSPFPLLVTRSTGLEHIHHRYVIEEAQLHHQSLSWKYPLYHGGFRLWEVATSLRRADLCMFLNRTDALYGVNCLGISPTQAHVVANGIPEEFLDKPPQDAFMVRGETIRIAMIGSNIPRKGFQYALSALHQVLTHHPQMQVSLFGTNCSETQIYSDIDPNIHKQIQVVPHFIHTNLPALLQDHHIQLFPSLSEGFGKALLEGMACGLAPITTATEGPQEIVQDGHDALVVPVRDSKAIEQALLRLLDDRVFLQRLRHNAYKTAQRYGWNCIAQNRLAIYEKALWERGWIDEKN